MKKKKLYLTAFLLVLALALQGGIFSGFSVPVQAAATSKKQTGFVKKNGSWYYYDKNGKKATGWDKSAAIIKNIGIKSCRITACFCFFVGITSPFLNQLHTRQLFSA